MRKSTSVVLGLAATFALLALPVTGSAIRLPPHTASVGADLYQLRCSGCHGMSGEGLVGPSLQSSTIPLAEVVQQVTNGAGTIFGGVILSQIDLAGAVVARNRACHRYVTVAMKEVKFLAPVYVGDEVSYWGRTLSVGSTSITVRGWNFMVTGT